MTSSSSASRDCAKEGSTSISDSGAEAEKSEEKALDDSAESTEL